ncbi:MAG: metallophosphoesterase [Candidatus Gygaella obscura]|nr:metallophosphoesterase [Candidatus Gygaella obscura]
MKIGIIADSHDNLDKLKKAVDIFNLNRLGFVFHAGDFIAPFTVPVLNSLKCDFLGVFGNNDAETRLLKKKSQGKIKKGPLLINKFGMKILLCHDLKKVSLSKREPDLVIFGHSHEVNISQKGKTLFINPGECCGWLTGRSTIAILDTGKMSFHILRI